MLNRHKTFAEGRARSTGLATVLTLALALALGLSACGSSGGSSSAGGNGSSGGTKTPAGASGSGGARAKAVKVCDLLPVADVAKLSGLPLTKAKAETLPASLPIAKCSYTSNDGMQEISVTTHGSQNADAAKKALSEEAGVMGGKKLADVGDVAYFSSALGVGGLTALYGATVIDVRATQELQQDVAVKIAEALHAKL